MLPGKAPRHDARGSAKTRAVVDTRVLIVDIDRQIGRALSFMLEARGYGEVRAVRSAARAQVIFGVFKPDIVFMELDPPDNLQLAELLRRTSQLRKFRLIGLTLDLQRPVRDVVRAVGVERYLLKPVAQAELDRTLGIPVTTG